MGVNFSDKPLLQHIHLNRREILVILKKLCDFILNIYYVIYIYYHIYVFSSVRVKFLQLINILDKNKFSLKLISLL